MIDFEKYSDLVEIITKRIESEYDEEYRVTHEWSKEVEEIVEMNGPYLKVIQGELESYCFITKVTNMVIPTSNSFSSSHKRLITKSMLFHGLVVVGGEYHPDFSDSTHFYMNCKLEPITKEEFEAFFKEQYDKAFVWNERNIEYAYKNYDLEDLKREFPLFFGTPSVNAFIKEFDRIDCLEDEQFPF